MIPLTVPVVDDWRPRPAGTPLARAELLARVTLGVPPWCREAWRPEHRPPLVTEEEIFSCLTEDQRAEYCA